MNSCAHYIPLAPEYYASIICRKRYVFFTKHVMQPFARECHAEKVMINNKHSATRVTQKLRSLISGCGMSRGFHPRSACSLRERRGTSGSTPCSLEASLQKTERRSLARSYFPRDIIRHLHYTKNKG
jgi:hypothetical protein